MIPRLINPKLLLIIGVSMAILIAAACGGDDEEATATSVAPAGTATSVAMEKKDLPPVQAGFSRVIPAELDPPTIPNVELDADQTLVWYHSGGFPVSTAPFKEAISGHHYFWWVFMTPFLWTPDGDGKVGEEKLRQGVARAYDVSDDTKTYIVHFNPEAVFTNGNPVTAALVKEAWEFGMWPVNQVTWGGILKVSTQIEGVQAVADGDELEASGLIVLDDHTLQINLTEANGVFNLELTNLRLGVYDVEDAKRRVVSWQESPVGVGPYQMTWDPTSGEITLVEADSPWPMTPAIKKIEMPYIDQASTNLIAYEAGDADVILASGQPAIIADQDHSLHGDLVAAGGSFKWYWGLDAGLPPTDDLMVRKALNHALDMDELADVILASTRPLSIVTESLPCHNSELNGYPFDPVKAREYLADSRYADDLPEIIITTRGFNQQVKDFMELAQAMWKENLGIDVKIDLIEPGNPLPDPDQIKQGSLGARIPDPARHLAAITDSKSPTVIGRQGDRPDADLDALLATALAVPYADTGPRCAAMQALEIAFLDRYYIIPWAMGFDFPNLVQPWVLGFKPTWERMSASLPYMKIGKRDRSLYE